MALPRPATPGDIPVSQFGQEIGWGTGETGTADSIARIQTITVDQLNNIGGVGLSPQLAKEWAEFYDNVALRNPANPTAAGRAQLLWYCYHLLDPATA